MRIGKKIFIFLLLTANTGFSQSNKFNFKELDKAIFQSAHLDSLKEKKIENLKKAIKNSTGLDLFTTFENLYEEYKVFNYDSAYYYAQKQLNVAVQLNHSQLVNCSKIKLGFLLLSGGLFKEAFDTLSIINPLQLEGNCKKEYYIVMARYYYDLADYTMDQHYSPQYNIRGNHFLDSALLLQPSGFDFSYYSGLKNIRSGNIKGAVNYFRKLINDPELTLHQQALATSTMSDIYIQRGQTDSAVELLTKAAIADIQSSTKETSAIFNLSNLLFKQGDLINASTYIEKAVKDAVSYGARQRKVQMSTILPLIEGEKIARVEGEKRTVTTYAVIVTFLLLLLIFLTFVIARQIKKLKSIQRALTLANLQQQEINTKLIEANKIKEQYIGVFFNANTAFYDKLEWFKKKAERKIADRKFEEIIFLINNLNIKLERDELQKKFDTIFLKLFPNFINSYNSLFAAEDRIQLKENEVLNTDLRIFALIRLGIHDNDKIAHILGYSVNTINTYKTKIKNKSIVANEQFEEEIMGIKSV